MANEKQKSTNNISHCPACHGKWTIVRTAHEENFSKRLKVCGKCNTSIYTYEVLGSYYEKASAALLRTDVDTIQNQPENKPDTLPAQVIERRAVGMYPDGSPVWEDAVPTHDNWVRLG